MRPCRTVWRVSRHSADVRRTARPQAGPRRPGARTLSRARARLFRPCPSGERADPIPHAGEAHRGPARRDRTLRQGRWTRRRRRPRVPRPCAGDRARRRGGPRARSSRRAERWPSQPRLGARHRRPRGHRWRAARDAHRRRSSRRALALDALRAVATSLLAELPEVIGVAASLHDGESPQVLGTETVLLAGTASAEDRIGGSTQLATFGSFVQAHRHQASRIHDMLARSLGVGDGAPVRVLDLYAGSGAISLALARAGAEVTAVEAFGPAAGRIEEAAARSDARVRAIHADVASALRTLVEQGARFDAVIVNPPRRGVGPVARAWLARLASPLIAYVSCDPDTLARDLDHLSRLGYRCASTQPLDMIPLSDEVETVAVLRRAPPARPRVLYEDETVLFVDKAPHEPTLGACGARVLPSWASAHFDADHRGHGAQQARRGRQRRCDLRQVTRARSAMEARARGGLHALAVPRGHARGGPLQREHHTQPRG